MVNSLYSDEIKKILIEFNNTERDYPSHKTIHELFEEQVYRTPDKTAIICEDTKISFKELNEKSNRIAHYIRNVGIIKNDIVGIRVTRSIEMVAGILGVLKAGGAFLPIDPSYPQERIEYMLSNSNTTILLTQGNIKNNICLNIKTINLEEINLSGGGKDNFRSINNSSDLAYVIYTSGSTGKPKGVMIEHKSVVNFIKGVTDKINFSQEKKILALTTISFDIFLLETLLPLIEGMTVVVAVERQQKNPKLISKLIIDNEIDMLQMTPSRLQLLITHNKSLHCLGNLKDIMIGGEAFPDILLEQLRELTDAKIYNMYGPTETTVWSTISDLTESNKVNIGKPIANTQIYILDEVLNILPMNVEGELCIAGDGVAKGYINKESLTAERFVSNPFSQDKVMYKTGDVARWLPDGNIEYLGRIDSQVKIRGYRVELTEIESQLLKHSLVQEAAVILKEGKGKDKFLCAYVVVSCDDIVTFLKDFLSKSLPEYMVPSYFIRIKSLPITPNGKIDRKLLSQYEIVFNNKFECEIKSEEVTKLETIEEGIKTILCDNIELSISKEQIDIDSDLSNLGINSITYVKIVVAAESEFGIEFDDEDLDIGRFKTVRDIVNYIFDKK